jgi:hypothetical protein
VPRHRPPRICRRMTLILDLAAGELKYEALSEKHGLSHQGIVHFNARNRDAIAQVRDAMATELGIELAGLWSVEKRARGLVLEQVLDDVDERLQNSSLTDAAWIKCQTLKVKVTRELSELCGQLPMRTTVEISLAPRLAHEVIGWDPVAWAQRLGAEEPYAPKPPVAPDELVRASTPSPTPAAIPASTVEPPGKYSLDPASVPGPPSTGHSCGSLADPCQCEIAPSGTF